jgi:hypothetical protein
MDLRGRKAIGFAHPVEKNLDLTSPFNIQDSLTVRKMRKHTA